MESFLLVCGFIFNLFLDIFDYLKLFLYGVEVKFYFFWYVFVIVDIFFLFWKDKMMFSCLGLGLVFDLYII